MNVPLVLVNANQTSFAKTIQALLIVSHAIKLVRLAVAVVLDNAKNATKDIVLTQLQMNALILTSVAKMKIFALMVRKNVA